MKKKPIKIIKKQNSSSRTKSEKLQQRKKAEKRKHTKVGFGGAAEFKTERMKL